MCGGLCRRVRFGMIRAMNRSSPAARLPACRMFFPGARALSALLVLLLLSPPTAAAAVHEYRLDNGLKLIVKEDRRAPVACVQLWYKVGSSYEREGVTGISHVLEHMMFQGTEKNPGNAFSRTVSRNGGRENAFTGRDYTAYYQLLERSRLPVGIALEADRMRNLILKEEQLATELEVVKEERRWRVEDSPVSYAYETGLSLAFRHGPYHHPIIGWMDDLEAMRIDDVRLWYRRWYAPNNAVLVVVGDVEPGEVLALAREHFGAFEAMDPLPAVPSGVPEQQGQRRAVVKRPAQVPYLFLFYKAPSLPSAVRDAAPDWEPYALEVLAGLLTGGESARLRSRLVRGQQVAASVSAGYNILARLPMLFTFSGTPARGRSVAELEEALRQEIRELRAELADEDELRRVKAQAEASRWYELDSFYYQALVIGLLESVGLSWQVQEEYVERIRAVTAEQVREVARKYLQDDMLTVVELEPLPLEAGAGRQRAAAEGGRHAR